MRAHLIIGNGFACNISGEFRYGQLREKADVELSNEAVELFSRFSSDNFEEILERLDYAATVADVVNLDVEPFIKLSAELRTSLISAIQQIHPYHPDQHFVNTSGVNDELVKYRKVFTTNYDLYLYWCRKGKNGFNIEDFFRSGQFEERDVDVDETAIYFVHGALHIFQAGSSAVKVHRGNRPTLIARISEEISQGRYPLFVSEGDGDRKMSRIKSNDYLRFCYDNLQKLDGIVEVFGHSLSSPCDSHLVEAIRKSEVEHIIFYEYEFDQKGDREKAALVAGLEQRLDKGVSVLDSSNHPLQKISAYDPASIFGF